MAVVIATQVFLLLLTNGLTVNSQLAAEELRFIFKTET